MAHQDTQLFWMNAICKRLRRERMADAVERNPGRNMALVAEAKNTRMDRVSMPGSVAIVSEQRAITIGKRGEDVFGAVIQIDDAAFSRFFSRFVFGHRENDAVAKNMLAGNQSRLNWPAAGFGAKLHEVTKRFIWYRRKSFTYSASVKNRSRRFCGGRLTLASGLAGIIPSSTAQFRMRFTLVMARYWPD